MTRPTDPHLNGTSPSEDEPEGFYQAPVSLRPLKAAARRRWRFWIGTALAGLVIGAGLHMVVAPHYKAVSDVWLVEPSGAPASEEVANDISLLRTREVADRAASLLNGHVPSGGSLSYSGVALSDKIVQITASGKSPADAVLIDNKVAEAFLQVRAEALTRELDTAESTLKAQLAGAANPTLAATLRTQLSNDQTDTNNAVNGSSVFVPAVPAKVSKKKVTIIDAASGLVAGLALGLGIVVGQEILSDRLRRRRDVATALGAQVELSVGRYRPRRILRQARLLRSVKRPGPRVVMVERRLRARLEAASCRALATVAVESEEFAGLAVSACAFALATEGRRVVVIDMAKGRPLGVAFGINKGHVGQVAGAGECSITLVVSPDDPDELAYAAESEDSDAVMVLASADPAFGADHIATWATDAVVVVAAGKASADRVRGIGQMLRQAGLVICSAILVGADEEDDSVGTVDSELDDFEGQRPLEALPAS